MTQNEKLLASFLKFENIKLFVKKLESNINSLQT